MNRELLPYVVNLRYNPETGELFWINYKNSGKEKLVGQGKDGNGYLQVNIKNRIYKQHRVCYYLMTGEWPECIDHINGVKSDNRWVNLRNTTQRDNCCNQKIHRDGKLPGICRVAGKHKWMVQILVGKTRYYLGTFNYEKFAHEAYQKAVNFIKNGEEHKINRENFHIRECANPFRGVSWSKTKKKYRAYITKNKKQIHLGYYDDSDDAIEVRLEAEREADT